MSGGIFPVGVPSQKMVASMTPNRRELMLAVMDNHHDLAGTMHIFSQYKHCDTILRWLLFNGITGKNLKDLIISDEIRGSVHKIVLFVVKESKERIPDARRSLS